MTEGDPKEELARLRAENERLGAELAAEAQKFRLFFEASPVAIGIVSFEHAKFLDVNDRYLELVDCTREEFFAQDAYQLWVTRTHPEDLERERVDFQRMVEGKIDSYRMKKRNLTKGEFRWFDFSSHTVRDERGRMKYAVLQFVDIHEQETAAETRERLFTPQRTRAGADTGVGLGFRIGQEAWPGMGWTIGPDDRKRRIVHQPGGGPGISAWLVIDRDAGRPRVLARKARRPGTSCRSGGSERPCPRTGPRPA